jgi:hypothetical protein
VRATNLYKGSRGIAPLILNLGAGGGWSASCPAISACNEASVSMGYEAGWLQSRCGCFGEEKNIHNFIGNRTRDYPGHRLVTIPGMAATPLAHVLVRLAQVMPTPKNNVQMVCMHLRRTVNGVCTYLLRKGVTLEQTHTRS